MHILRHIYMYHMNHTQTLSISYTLHTLLLLLPFLGHSMHMWDTVCVCTELLDCCQAGIKIIIMTISKYGCHNDALVGAGKC